MNTIKNVGDIICVLDPSEEFYVIGEIGHIVQFPPIVMGAMPVTLYYIISFDDSKNINTDSEVDFEYYDVIDSLSDQIVEDEDMIQKIAEELDIDIDLFEE